VSISAKLRRVPSDASSRAPVRARARRALRAEITAQALALFSERGFDAVTADELAEVVGVSRRTLFRLFATKEDIVVAAFDTLGDEALAALRERPAGEAAWTALRQALGAAAARLEEHPATFFELHDVIAQTPALRRRLLEQRDGWRAAFAQELGARAVTARNEFECELLAAAAIGAFDVATETWARSRGRRRLRRLLDDSFERLGSGLDGH
jgi:AcrR family transcriptional regulator